MSDLLSKITNLSPAKRELLERKYREKEKRQDTEPIQPRPTAAAAPLSFGQQRLWFLDQWEPGNPAYNISRVVGIDGPLDITSIERGLTEILRRHETLRTTFAAEASTPVQTIHPAEPAAVRVLDLSAVQGGQQEAEAFRLAQEEATRPFDLVKGPLLRTTLLRLDAEKHLLILSIHHIVADGWSLTVLYRELFALYEGFTEEQPCALPELPIQYADFAAWQRRRLQGERLRSQLSYWREQLRDITTLGLATDRPRPPIQTFTGATFRIQLSQRLTDDLRSLSRREGATLFMTLLAAYQALLHRYTGQDDIVVGSPIAGRMRVEVEGLIGFFVNMLVLRTDTSGDPTFLELLQRVKKGALQSFDHQEVPFEKLVEEIHPPRDPSRNPLFQVVFALQNASRPFPVLKRLKLASLNPPKSVIRFDLEVHLEENQDGLDGLFVYNTALFDSPTIGRMAAHFQMMLEGIVAEPDRRLSELPLLTEAERELLVEWNDTATDYPRDFCIHEILEAQAEATPDADAVSYGGERLTYRQLNERSNRLAHHLRTLGVGPDVRVAICIERSIQMIVGLVGILKAGGAYVPLEPSYPGDRIAFMMEDANVGVVLTEEKNLPDLPQTRVRPVCLDRESFAESSCENPDAGVEPTNLAYVIYTSGSTGKPKGVSVPHRAVVRLVLNTNYVELTPADRIAQVSNASFDAATFEIWGALLNGASLIGIPQAVVLSPKDLAREIKDLRITTMFLTSSLFNQIASEVPAAFTTLRYLLVGGETCDPKWARQVLRHGPPQRLLNAYGPTENTTFTTCHHIESVGEHATAVPIGRPISNSSVYILDRYGNRLPVGVIGELFTGGDGLAREYLNRPELTSEKFQRDPFNDDRSARVYRTGDFARYHPDGSIDFVGRVDQQVKIRGFRIELQEIEATLAQHPQVSKSAVIARQSDGSDKRLVAYVVPAGGVPPSTDDLRRFLRARLPDYMTPSAFVSLDALPLTTNGKVDHAALPAPTQDRNEHARDFAEPRTPIQKELARIWEALLSVERVGIHDNFFDLGGHSLLAIQMIARIERQFKKTLPVAVLFESPTIAQLTDILSEKAGPHQWSSLMVLQPKGDRQPFFWVHGDLSNALLPGFLGADQPLYGLEHQGEDGRPALQTTVDTIAKYYLDEVRSVCPHGPYLLGGYSFGALLAFEMAQQLRNQGEDVALLFMLDPTGHRIEHRSRLSRRNRLQRHLRTFARLGFREKPDYILSRLRGMVQTEITEKIGERLKTLHWKVCLWTNRVLPPSVRSSYILDVYQKAITSYVPQKYSGPVTIFTVQDCTYLPPMDWVNVITGEIDVHEGPGEHMDMTKRPYVALWAGRLKTALDRAQESFAAGRSAVR